MSAVTKMISAQIPHELFNQIEDLSASMERSKTWILKQALADFCEKEALKERLIAAGIQEAEQGYVVSHEEMGNRIEAMKSRKRAEREAKRQ